MKTKLTILSLIWAVAFGQGVNTNLIVSFNCASDFWGYPGNMVSTPTLPFIPPHARWYGGSCSEEYLFDSDDKRFTPNITDRNLAFGKYAHFNYRNNPIWPFIKMITKDLTQDATVQWVIPVMNYYVGTRPELLANYQKLDQISTNAQMQSSDFSPEFKKYTQDIVNTYYALKDNRVRIDISETGNEHYSDMGNDALNFLGNYPRLIYCRKNNTALALTIHEKLVSMIVRVVRNEAPNMIFLFPISEQLAGGFSQWNNWFIAAADRMKVQGFTMHLYAPPVASTDILKVYSSTLTYQNNSTAYIQNVVVPAINGKRLSISEASVSENNSILRGTDFDRQLFLNWIKLFQTIPNIISVDWHAFSNNYSTQVAVKMNGSSKAADIKLMPLGIGFMSLQK